MIIIVCLLVFPPLRAYIKSIDNTFKNVVYRGMNSPKKVRDLKKTRFSRAAPRPESDEILGNLGASDLRRGLDMKPRSRDVVGTKNEAKM